MILFAINVFNLDDEIIIYIFPVYIYYVILKSCCFAIESIKCLFSQLIGMKKLQLFTQLHLSEQSWLRTAEHCSIYLLSKVAMRVLFNVLNMFLCLCRG